MPLLCGALFLLSTLPAVAEQATTIYTPLVGFTDVTGLVPQAELLLASDGNFYGTASAGGSKGDGTVFELTPAGALSPLGNFNGRDGDLPGGGLIQGSDGNFYGTTAEGGNAGDGAVFMITPAGTLTTLHRFDADGSHPRGSLTLGSDGNFYGTTMYTRGTTGDGTIFMITPAGDFTNLYIFQGDDGTVPNSGLAQNGDGNFYGTTSQGGAYGGGTVFKITPAGGLVTLHDFTGGDDGQNPLGALVLAGDGNFYGTTSQKGVGGDGTVFRITAAGALSPLYSFSGIHDGAFPQSGLTVGRDGALYGTTLGNSSGPMGGSVYRITLDGTFSGLVTFMGGNGAPVAGLTVGGDGALYGTTTLSFPGGGFVYKVVQAVPGFFTFQLSITDGVDYLAFPGGNVFGYYSFLADPRYIFHFDLGYEYVADANDGKDGVYLYDFASRDFFYTSPNFPFPYLYDFNLDSVVYYLPDPNNAGHYNIDGVRYFYVFNTGQIVAK